MKLRLLLGLLLNCCVGLASAQTPSFRAYPLKDFPDARPKIIYQDSKGLIWLAGADCLLQFDGSKYKSIALPDSLGKEVSALREMDGFLWIGFKNGNIALLSTTPGADAAHANQLRPWQPEEGAPKRSITGFAQDKAGNIWFSTYGEGLYCWTHKRLYQFGHRDDGLSSDDIYTICADPEGCIWAATDAGISICRIGASGDKHIRILAKKDGLPDEIVTTLQSDKHGDIWIGTYEFGFCRYQFQTKKFDHYTPSWALGPITTIAVFGHEELWLGTQRRGCVRYNLNRNKLTFLPEKHPLAHQKISQSLKDREGRYWVLTDQGKLFASNIRFGLLETPSPDVQAVGIDPAQNIWIGAENGLFKFENEQFTTILPSTNIISLATASNGIVLAGSFGEGLWVLAPNGAVRQHLTEADGLTNGSILSIAIGKNSVYLATLGGVTECNWLPDGTLGHCSTLQSLGASYVYKVYVDTQNRLWMGVDGKGLFVYDGRLLKNYRKSADQTIKTVLDIAEDKRGRIWFTTPESGLFVLEGNTIRQYTRKNRLHSNSITCLSTERNGQLVLGYEDGIDIFSPETGHVAHYNPANGLPIEEVNLNAHCKDKIGNLWLGATKGLLRIATFDEFYQFDPTPFISAVYLFMKPISFLEKNEFKHDENYLLFEINGLWFTNPEAVEYRYRLEGYDLDWKETRDHQISYSNLPPGKYRFRFQTTEHGDFEHTPEASYAFQIIAPFYSQWWFVLLVSALLGSLFYAWIHTRDRRFQREAQLKKENTESQLATLKSQINPHFLFNSFNTLVTIIEENPRVAVDYVEHMSDFYRSMMAYREKELIPLEEEMKVVNDFYYLLRKRYEDSFSLSVDLNPAGAFIMPFSLQMLIENAVKHNIISKSNPLKVEIFRENNHWIVVRNNLQPKTGLETSTHFGLQSLQQRYQLLCNQAVIVEKTDQFFIVKVPIINQV